MEGNIGNGLLTSTSTYLKVISTIKEVPVHVEVPRARNVFPRHTDIMPLIVIGSQLYRSVKVRDWSR